jgi:DAACS family dicarboxylate/amino acid:cation (Na+ or H+) symporter
MKRVPFYLWILVAMGVGLMIGPLLGKDAASLGELGKLVIQLIKAVATPLLFFAILNAILKTELDARAGARMVLIATINATIALCIGLGISNLLKPGEHLATAIPNNPEAAAAYAGKQVDFLKTFVSYIPSNFVSPFADNIIISIILIALLLGFGLRSTRSELGVEVFKPVEQSLDILLKAMEVILTWVIKLIPLAVFGVVAKTVGEYGFEPLKGLAVYLAVGLGGLALQIVFTYQAWLLFWLKIPLLHFWNIAREPIIYAIGTNSSLATLPITLKALDRLGVSKMASTLGACVGTNLNNDGIILYEGMAVLFVAQAHGITLDLGQQLLAAITCMVAAMGVAGVPEAGFISLALVVNTVGLPVELLPLLLTVDWIIARARSVVNVLSDMLLSMLIDVKESKETDRLSV